MVRMFISALACMASLIGVSSAHAQGQPVTWRYQMQAGVSTATYPGDVKVSDANTGGDIQIRRVGATPSLGVGSNIYPTNVGGSGAAKYDATSNVLTNAIGANYGFFGLASKDNVQWPNTYISGIDATGHVQLYSVSNTGNYGIAAASRSSDNNNAAPQDVIGGVHLAVADNTSIGQNVWGTYSAAYQTPTGLARVIFGHEITTANQKSDSPFSDPFNMNPTALTSGIRLTCGDGAATPNFKCSNVISVSYNNAVYRSGIVFGAGSLDQPIDYADMVVGPTNYGYSWFNAANVRNWRIVSTSTGGSLDQMLLGNGTFNITFTNGSANALSLTPTLLTVPSLSAARVKLAPVLVSALPACNPAANGTLAAVSDATAPAWNAALTGGGAVNVMAYCNGTQWTAH